MNTQDKEAVEAAEKHADQIVGPPPYDLQKWKHRKLGFIAGVEWQKQHTVDILKEPPPLGYGMDWYIEKITGIKQREKPVIGEDLDD